MDREAVFVFRKAKALVAKMEEEGVWDDAEVREKLWWLAEMAERLMAGGLGNAEDWERVFDEVGERHYWFWDGSGWAFDNLDA